MEVNQVDEVTTNPHIFVSIDKDGIVTIVAHRAEMDNCAARTSLPMIVADEVDADWARAASYRDSYFLPLTHALRFSTMPRLKRSPKAEGGVSGLR